MRRGRKHLDELVGAGVIEQAIVVSDQGAGVVNGCALAGLTHDPDLFHLLRHLSRFGARFYKQALAAIKTEYERGQIGVGQTEPVINRRRAHLSTSQDQSGKEDQPR